MPRGDCFSFAVNKTVLTRLAYSHWKLEITVYKVFNMDIILTQMHQFTSRSCVEHFL